MRRSSSTSHIPLSKGDFRSRPKSLVRSTAKDVPVSAKKHKESLDRMNIPNLKRSSSLLNLKKSTASTPTVGSSKNATFKKSLGTTPTLSSAGPSGFKRSISNIVTPASSRSRSRSPYKIGTDKINDKKWISEQYCKVCRYLQENTTIQENLKPPTINTFVKVMQHLLKQYNPRIELNTMNYKDIVFNILKMLNYPGQISNSLLKTVNTMHAWPQIISIFAWLVDLITATKHTELFVSPTLQEDLKYQEVDCITNYLVQRYLQYNNDPPQDHEGINKEFEQNFAKILNIDEEENKLLEIEVTNLCQLKNSRMKELTEQQTKIDCYQNEIDKLQSEIDAFYSNKEEKQEDINCALEMVKNRRDKLVDLIKTKRNSIETLTETIKTQPCTVIEKKRMLKHIEEMKHTIDLLKEKQKQKKFLTDDSELSLVQARKKVETEVYRLNTSLMKLVIREPTLKILHLQEIDFFGQKFRNDVESLEGNFRMFKEQFAKRNSHLKSLLSKQEIENSALKGQMENLDQSNQSLAKQETSIIQKIEKINQDIEIMTKKCKEQRNEFKEKIKNLKESAPNVDEKQHALEEITELATKNVADFENLKEGSVDFFVQLHNIIMGKLVKMNEKRTELFTMMAENLEKIHQNQKDILEDLHNLDPVREETNRKI